MNYGDYHLTYCSNIHPGETWSETFANLHQYIPSLKQKLAPKTPFGIGLRLSHQAVDELLDNDNLHLFKKWLETEKAYVFTMNGFPYGSFHRAEVKDMVHQPDWTTPERLEYTHQLFQVLAEVLPFGMEGGISTSPLSYKPWFADKPEQIPVVFQKSTENLLKILDKLINIEEETGKFLHLDIEPEPDGLLENSWEFIAYYQDYLVPAAQEFLKETRDLNAFEAENTVKQYIQLCYDVCHFAVAYEDHAEAIQNLQEAGIGIGKFQISAALKADLTSKVYPKSSVIQALQAFNESTYLHQVIQKNANQTRQQFADLPQALKEADNPNADEWRIHFHVPIFTQSYPPLESTQKDILEIIKLLKIEPLSPHLEIETYTWEVLPTDLQINLEKSIEREMRWLMEALA